MSTFFDVECDKTKCTNHGDINLGNLSELEIHEKLLPVLKELSLSGVDICLKKYKNDYYFSVPICIANDGYIYIDPRISKNSFVFDDLSMPNDLTCIKFLDKFVSSSFKRSCDYIDIFYTNSSNKLHMCEPHPFEFSPSLYEIYPNYESAYEGFSIFKVPDTVKNERIDVSKNFVWYLYSELKYLSMSIKTFPSMSVAVNSVETLDYYNPDKPPTDEPGKWKKVVHRFRTEWIPSNQYASITPAAAPWIEKV